MKGDFTRYTFDPRKHYSAVLDQQGRVRTDADKLEEVGIEGHLRQTALRDIVGQSGAPAENAGFRLRVNRQGVLLIGDGNYYVNGILCQNDERVSFIEQPYLPGQDLPSVEGDRRRFLAYLDVWQRHVTAIEDPQVREVALGGPDTTTRLQTVWQVKLIQVDADAHCLGALPEWDELIAPPDSRLSARARPPEDADDLCRLPPDARYTGLTNQLYRVEIRQGGGLDEATFVWDDENGAVAFPIEEFVDEQPTDRIRLGSGGKSVLSTLNSGDTVEVTDDRIELTGEPGVLRTIDIDHETGIIRLDELVDGLSLEAHPKIRRWKGGGEVRIEADEFTLLENGVEVRFDGSQFRSGDHWMIPARTATRDVEWPTEIQDDDEPEPVLRPPHGIKHHFAKLALLDFGNGDAEVVEDCRNIFPALARDALRIRRVRTASDGQPFRLNGTIRATDLTAGLLLEFSAPLAAGVFRLSEREGRAMNAVIEVQLALPEPLTPGDRQFWGVEQVFGFHPVILASTISVENDRGDTILWRPDEPARIWLRQVFARLGPNGQIPPPLRGTLRVRGNFIWTNDADGNRIFLDGEATANLQRRDRLNLPSGNGQPGGDFFAWFWMVSDNTTPLDLAVEVQLNVVSGVVSSGGTPISGATVRLRSNSGIGAGSEQTTETDAEGRFSFTALQGNYTVIAEALGTTAEEDVEVGPVIAPPPGGGGGGGGPGGPGGPGDLAVREINGIGENRARLLAANGVSRIAEFLELSPRRISEILNVSLNRANQLIANARRRLEQ